MKYPVWKFHKEKKPEGVIVHSAKEEEALGPGWVSSPLEFDSKPGKVKVEVGSTDSHQASGEEPKVEAPSVETPVQDELKPEKKSSKSRN